MHAAVVAAGLGVGILTEAAVGPGLCWRCGKQGRALMSMGHFRHDVLASGDSLAILGRWGGFFNCSQSQTDCWRYYVGRILSSFVVVLVVVVVAVLHKYTQGG